MTLEQKEELPMNNETKQKVIAHLKKVAALWDAGCDMDDVIQEGEALAEELGNE